MTKAAYALSGRRIRLVAPARWPTIDVIERFQEAARRWDAEVEVDPICLARDGQLAGDDRARAAALEAALGDPKVDIVWAARGGYGSPRLLKHLARNPGRRAVFAGFSDMTALHQLYWGGPVAAVHCGMAIDLSNPEKAANLGAAAQLLGALLDTGRPPTRSFALNAVRKGEASAPLAPVNLAVLTRLLGTPYEPAWDRVILAIEDIEEYLYAIDRMAWHLASSRLAPRIAGVVIGEFVKTLDNETPWGRTIEEIVALHFPNVPIATGLPFGHGARNEPFLVGEPARLVVSAGGATLELSGGAAA
jgi:muramoyltetrapeptide carboxypeptidase